MTRPAVVLASLTMLLAGCGSTSTTGKLAAAAKHQFQAQSSSCTKAGLGEFAGQRETVYECRLDGVPPAMRPIAHLDARSLMRCFVYTDGAAYDVTRQIVAMTTAGAVAGFSCR